MVVEVFTLYDLVHRRFIVFHDEGVDAMFRERALCRGEHVHVNGPASLGFFTQVGVACTSCNKSCKHIHYGVSPNSEIAVDVDFAWGIMSLVPMLSDITGYPPDILILSTDKYSAKYLEYLRKQLPELLADIRRSGVTIMSNIPVVQLCASFQISPKNSYSSLFCFLLYRNFSRQV